MSQQRRSSRSSRSSVDQPSPGHVLTRNTGPLITTNVFIAFSSLGSSSYPKKFVSTLRSSDAEGFILTFNDHMWQNSSEERIFTVSNKLFSILGQRAAAASLSVLYWDSRNKKNQEGNMWYLRQVSEPDHQDFFSPHALKKVQHYTRHLKLEDKIEGVSWEWVLVCFY